METFSLMHFDEKNNTDNVKEKRIASRTYMYILPSTFFYFFVINSSSFSIVFNWKYSLNSKLIQTIFSFGISLEFNESIICFNIVDLPERLTPIKTLMNVYPKTVQFSQHILLF